MAPEDKIENKLPLLRSETTEIKGICICMDTCMYLYKKIYIVATVGYKKMFPLNPMILKEKRSWRPKYTLRVLGAIGHFH